jgi:lipopolysaccharide export system protein LptA
LLTVEVARRLVSPATAVGLSLAIVATWLLAFPAFAQDSSGHVEAKRPSHASKGAGAHAKAELSTPQPRPRATPSDNPFDVMKASPERGPIRIKSDTLDLDYKTKQVFYRGHVHAVQADAALDSDTLQVIYGASFNDIQQVIAIGNVRMTRGTDVVTGKHAVLDEAKQTVVVTGDPIIQNGRDRVAGDRILVYLENQRSVVENAHAILYPRQTQEGNGKKPGAEQKTTASGQR